MTCQHDTCILAPKENIPSMYFVSAELGSENLCPHHRMQELQDACFSCGSDYEHGMRVPEQMQETWKVGLTPQASPHLTLHTLLSRGARAQEMLCSLKAERKARTQHTGTKHGPTVMRRKSVPSACAPFE